MRAPTPAVAAAAHPPASGMATKKKIIWSILAAALFAAWVWIEGFPGEMLYGALGVGIVIFLLLTKSVRNLAFSKKSAAYFWGGVAVAIFALGYFFTNTQELVGKGLGIDTILHPFNIGQYVGIGVVLLITGLVLIPILKDMWRNVTKSKPEKKKDDGH